MKSLRPWCELVRLPNVFTAAADILAGYWLATQALDWSWRLGCLLAASAALYSAGIVLNDLRDIEIDRAQRPDRPLPSGRILPRQARVLTACLLAFGVVLAGVAGMRDEAIPLVNRTTGVAIALVAAILAYNLYLKSTRFGPLAMGACRGLNLVLPMTAVFPLAAGPLALAPLTHMLYVASITTFGRDETERSRRRRLTVATAGIAASVLLLSIFVAWNHSKDSLTLVIWLAIGFHLLRVAVRAVRKPEAPVVQYAMKTFIFGIVAIDALLATSAVGWPAGAIVLGLLVPALVLGRWIYST